jgi:membrane-bound lytic murein transglycosylase B
MSARPTIAVPVALVTLLAVQSLVMVPHAKAAVPTSYDVERERFVDEMVDRHDFDAAELTALMASARYQQAIVDAMNRPYEEKAWGTYRQLFVTPERIAGGQRFLAEHKALLDQVEAAYGVPAELIVAIIGIETNYGQTLGPHRVLDALTTLGFSYPRRAAFFRKELEQFLLLARDEQLDPATVRGSYAGAVGRPQFIPSSYRAYAVDFDGDGRRDLWASDADVIGSVGAYLAQHGWRRGEPIASPAELSRALGAGIPVGGKRPVVPEVRVEQLLAAGVKPAAALDSDALAALIELDNGGSEYWVTLENFYAITRYNHSNLYALAALQLSEAIASGGEDGGD